MNNGNVQFSSLYAVPNRNGVYVTKDNHGFGTSIINMGELFGNEFISHGEGEKVNLNNSEKATSLLEDGDLLFARRSLVESGAGKCSIVLQPSEELTFESSVIRIRLDKTKAIPLFYYYWFRSNTGKSAMRTLVTGSNVKGIKGSELGTLYIPKKTLAEQANITNFLWSIDSKIANNNDIINLLERQAKLLYDYWFVQFDFPDENGKPYKSSGGKMVWNEELKREIPEGWEVKMLPEVVQLQYGFPLATSLFGADGIGVVRIRDILENSISAKTTETVSNEYLSQEGDLLVGMDGNFQMNYWTRNGDIVNQRITRIRKSDIPLVIIRMQIEPYINAKIDSVARSTVGHLGDADFKLQRILVPFGINLQPFDLFLQKIIELRKENQQLASLRDFLLPMLMNGQVKVKSADA